MTILLFVFVFCLVVISHEFGHYIVAKINGVRVIEFTVGMGPKLVSYHKNGTDYCIRLLPIGGACIYDMGDMLDETSEDDGRDKEIVKETEVKRGISENKEGHDDGFLNEKQGIPYVEAPVFVKIAIVIAGPLFNFILAYLIALIVVWNTGSTTPVINGLIDGYPAQEAGMQPGDLITKMNGSRVCLASEIYVNTYLGKEHDMTIEFIRDGEKHTVTVTPVYDEAEGRYLVGFRGYGKYITCKDLSVFKYSYYEVRYGFVGVTKTLLMLLQGRGSKDDIAGPVGMAQTIDEVREVTQPYGPWVLFLNILNLSMLISVNLGIINLLPLPAIDGGKLIFLFVEVIRGKPVPPEKEGIVHLVGFALLAVLMVFVMYNDILRLIAG
ncbi:MAG: site-2 protease family protein [Lachnospiraceae bacterium]|nr:site-2 protease family protein [Candidatus Colinaster scatohippi]